MTTIYFKVPALSDTLVSIERFDGQTISALKCAIRSHQTCYGYSYFKFGFENWRLNNRRGDFIKL
jgi:hypothetical protein